MIKHINRNDDGSVIFTDFEGNKFVEVMTKEELLEEHAIIEQIKNEIMEEITLKNEFNFLATWLNKDDITVELNDGKEQLTILANNKNGVWKAEALYFSKENKHYDCPACKISHWNDDSMKCADNEKLRDELFNKIYNSVGFQDWLKNGNETNELVEKL